MERENPSRNGKSPPLRYTLTRTRVDSDELVGADIVGLCASARGKRVVAHGLGDREDRRHNCVYVSRK